MTQITKALLVDDEGKYLLMTRSDHPAFPDDPDLPGGTVEAGETVEDALVREVVEEAGITIDISQATLLYKGTAYSNHGNELTLYRYEVGTRPEVVISWEHRGFEWVDRDTLVHLSEGAIDRYMHMVADTLKKTT